MGLHGWTANVSLAVHILWDGQMRQQKWKGSDDNIFSHPPCIISNIHSSVTLKARRCLYMFLPQYHKNFLFTFDSPIFCLVSMYNTEKMTWTNNKPTSSTYPKANPVRTHPCNARRYKVSGLFHLITIIPQSTRASSQAVVLSQTDREERVEVDMDMDMDMDMDSLLVKKWLFDCRGLGEIPETYTDLYRFRIRIRIRTVLDICTCTYTCIFVYVSVRTCVCVCMYTCESNMLRMYSLSLWLWCCGGFASSVCLSHSTLHQPINIINPSRPHILASSSTSFTRTPLPK